MLLRSPVRVGAPEELRSVLLRSTPGSELLRSQGRCSSGAGARGGSCQERPSPTTHNPSPPMKLTPTTELSGGIFLHGGYTERT